MNRIFASLMACSALAFAQGQSAENRPFTRTFADKQENPNRIEQRFDKTDKACIKRPGSAANAFYKKDV